MTLKKTKEHNNSITNNNENFENKLNKEKLNEIKQTLSKIEKSLKEKYPDFFTKKNVEVLRSIYRPLERVYGGEWIVLAVMYELFDKKKRGYGYDRKSNYNPTGLLISMACEKGASFEEFLSKFCKLFGLEQELSRKVEPEKECQERAEKDFYEQVKEFLAFRTFMREKIKDSAVYKVLFESGLNEVKEEN